MNDLCIACQYQMVKRLAPWLLYCNRCRLWSSRLGCQDSKLQSSTIIIEKNRELGLKELRIQNFQKLLDALKSYMKLNRTTLCDVGCSYGWFLETATRRGMKVMGIEPEESVALVGIHRGLDIRIGYFPECMNSGEEFDLITFNDSLEHLVDISKVLKSCHNLLKPSGKLAINIPTTSGLFFRLSVGLYQIGYKAPLNRLWQKDYTSPHLFYFNQKNLEMCVNQYGFRLLHSNSLKSVTISGLWKRIRMDKNSSLVSSVLIYAFFIAIYPLLYILPSDNMLQIYEKVQ